MCMIMMSFIGCADIFNTKRELPPESIFSQYGIDGYIVSEGMILSQAKGMLDKYEMDNDYTLSTSGIVIYVAKSNETDKYYTIFAPQSTKYDVLVFETPIPDFSVIQQEVSSYNQDDTTTQQIDLCDNHCQLVTTYEFRSSDYIGTELFDDLKFPILLRIGKLSEESEEDLGVFVGIKDNQSYVVFSIVWHEGLSVLFEF